MPENGPEPEPEPMPENGPEPEPEPMPENGPEVEPTPEPEPEAEPLPELGPEVGVEDTWQTEADTDDDAAEVIDTSSAETGPGEVSEPAVADTSTNDTLANDILDSRDSTDTNEADTASSPSDITTPPRPDTSTGVQVELAESRPIPETPGCASLPSGAPHVAWTPLWGALAWLGIRRRRRARP